jgi:hypothetical protein
MSTRADRRGNGFVINGRKHWITGGGVSRLQLVFARVFDENGKEEGIGGFIAIRDETKGLKIGQREPAMGLRGSPRPKSSFSQFGESENKNAGDGYPMKAIEKLVPRFLGSHTFSHGLHPLRTFVRVGSNASPCLLHPLSEANRSVSADRKRSFRRRSTSMPRPGGCPKIGVWGSANVGVTGESSG